MITVNLFKMLEIAPILIMKKKMTYPPLPTCLKKFLAETLLLVLVTANFIDQYLIQHTNTLLMIDV